MKKPSISLTMFLSLIFLLISSNAFAAESVPLFDYGDGSLVNVINNITNWVLGFAGALAVLFVIYGGLLFITSAGNEKRVDAAKKTLTYAVLGIIVIVLAYFIVKLIINSTTGLFPKTS